MQSTFSMFWPFLIFTIIIAFLGLVLGSTIIVFDLRKMQRECEKGLPSIWYRRLNVRQGIECVGISLALLLFISAIEYSLAHHFSLPILSMIMASIGIIASGVLLVVDLRKMQQERREGRLSLWHRRPATLKYLGQILICLAFLLMMGDGAYEQAQGFPDSYFPWNLIFFFVEVLICLLGVALSFYAKRLQKQGGPLDT
ncbi:MAG: hypothetical protein ABI456_11580 [Ktedonobacteraceae bacterium]